MSPQEHFSSVHFHHYKAFKDFSISLDRFNILVGPNNAGKSTILGAFRILSEAIRKARSRNPVLVRGPNGTTHGYQIDLGNSTVAMENVFFDYDDSEPATVRFKISNGNELILYFPEPNVCNLICQTTGKTIHSCASFRTQFDVGVAFVPILGPVDPDELLYQPEAARLALLTHRAARNFRNIWHHYPEDFTEFKSLIKTTWPGMDIDKPEVDVTHDKPLLRMFCPEERIPREIYWSGFGFQVWCQMVTYIVRGKGASLFIIDEPDIYLHSDLQRQLLGILKNLGPDILIATHSTEIITEADPDDLLLINKKQRWAKRIKDPSQIQTIFGVLGSNLNPMLTQLAKTRRVLFVEGKDFQVLSRFAAKVGKAQVANRSDFAVIPTDGFNTNKIRTLKEGIELTLGTKILAGAIFDRDYRSDDQCCDEISQLKEVCRIAHIHQRKELENFLLIPSAITKAIQSRLKEREQRGDEVVAFAEDVSEILNRLTEPMRFRVESQYLAKRRPYSKSKISKLDDTTIDERSMAEFDSTWNSRDRFNLIPGKEVLTSLNRYLQDKYKICITAAQIVSSLARNEVPNEMVLLIDSLEEFRTASLKEVADDAADLHEVKLMGASTSH